MCCSRSCAKNREQREERQHHQRAIAVGGPREGREQPDRGEQRVDHIYAREDRDLQARRDSAHEPLADGGACDVAENLGGEGQDIERHIVPGGPATAGDGDHERRADRVPRVRRVEQQPVGMDAALDDRGDIRHGGPDGNCDRDRPRRQQQEHGNEHDLRRHHHPRADLEAHDGGERIRERERKRQPEVERRRVMGDGGDRECGRDEHRDAAELDVALPVIQRLELTRPAVRHEALDRGAQGAARVEPRKLHERCIGSETAVLKLGRQAPGP
jgi:hypothetical protein